jgi:alkylated DNA repair protein (DNA oxidative demethylase)
MTLDLFDDTALGERTALGTQAMVLHGFALPGAEALLQAVQALERISPPRAMVTPGGYAMSVRLTNCGALGWTTDRHGHRYTAIDPLTKEAWPPMPDVFAMLAAAAAACAGFEGFVPDACLVNHYAPGARMSLHQDKNERDLRAPIVSVSLGMPAVFLWGGSARADKALRVPLRHGDVAVWGAQDRLRYHGVMPLQDLPHPLLGSERINLTFRRAGLGKGAAS